MPPARLTMDSHYDSERANAATRRKALRVLRPPGSEDASWGLAFSGGGIRSATFCLGVMHGLARCTVPDAWKPVAEAPATEAPPQRHNLLRQFDYLSTVSGGGYIGSFFGSLFVQGRLSGHKGETASQTADMAFKVFEEEPPGRLRSDVAFDAADPGKAPLAWLRENGRYMAPTGSGDLVYAVGLQIRNWFAMQWVVGSVLFLSFVLLALGRVVLMQGVVADSYRSLEIRLLSEVLVPGNWVWWSPVWLLTLPVMALWLLPSALAFWQSHPGRGCSVSDKPSRWSAAVWGTAAVALVLLALSLWFYWNLDDPAPMASVPGAMAALSLLGMVFYQWTTGSASIAAQRVRLTRWFATGLIWLVALVVLAAVDTLAQSLYVKQHELAALLTPSAAIAALVWMVRQITAALDEKDRPGWAAKLPLDLVAGVAGVLLMLAITLVWAVMVEWIRWNGILPTLTGPDAMFSPFTAERARLVLLGFTVFALVQILIIGQFPGFLNLSTLQGLYSARLTRAYLGASNGHRFSNDKSGEERGQESGEKSREASKLRSVAEPAPGDSLELGDYASNPLAPLHIVNVCLNQNIDPGEQLVQRDRKGKPLAVMAKGFCIDGEFFPFPEDYGNSELYAPLSVGEWVGVSGAAFSTGMGRRNSLGYALLMGLSNVRLGRWWASGQGAKASAVSPWYDRLARWLFKTQAYLLDELLSHFHGTRRPLHYLSDGGHYENTAMYELLRKQRGLRLIVVCDCGCDPAYEFQDLANLIRLVRIDYQAEVEVDSDITRDAQLGLYFGLPGHFAPGYTGDNAATKCALLLNVFQQGRDASAGRTLATRIVVLKPRLIAGLAADLAQYKSTRAAFPQEPTADQFYDEAQWESYRKLGLEITSAVFGAKDPRQRDALWSRLAPRAGAAGAPAAPSAPATRNGKLISAVLATVFALGLARLGG